MMGWTGDNGDPDNFFATPVPAAPPLNKAQLLKMVLQTV